MSSKLVAPHGGKGLVCALLEGAEREAELKKAGLSLLGSGAFFPLSGSTTKADWKCVCENFQMADGTFWPVPITLDVTAADAAGIKVGDEIALVRKGETFATMKVTEKFEMTEADKRWECEKVFKGEGEESVGDKFWEIAPKDHPGVIMVLAQKDVNLAGPVKVLSEGEYKKE